MNLLAVFQELTNAADTIEGLNCFPYPPDRVTPPVFYPLLPEAIEYNGTYDRGMDSMTIEADLLVGKADDAASFKQLAPFCDGSGDSSIVQALQTYPYTACDVVTVNRAELVVVKIGTIDHLGAQFTISIAGSGA